MERFTHKLPIGMQVLFYPQGDLQTKVTFGAGPLLGLVHRCDGGICDIHVFNHKGGTVLKKNVYHPSHPDLYDANGQRTQAALDWGIWTFTESSQREWDTYYQPAIDKAKAEASAALEAAKAEAAKAEAKGKSREKVNA